jgi:hypothetical protein
LEYRRVTSCDPADVAVTENVVLAPGAAVAVDEPGTAVAGVVGVHTRPPARVAFSACSVVDAVVAAVPSR